MQRFNKLLLVCLSGLMFHNLMAGDFKNKSNIGFNLSSQKLLGDTRSGDFGYGVSPFFLRYNFKPSLYLETDLGFAQLSTIVNGVEVNTEMINLGMKLGVKLLTQRSTNPLFYLGFGTFSYQKGNGSSNWAGYVAIGGGVELALSDKLAFNITTDYRYTSSDGFDGSNSRPGYDGFINIGFGLNYYLGHSGVTWMLSKENEHVQEKNSLYTESAVNGGSENNLEENSSNTDIVNADMSAVQKDSLLNSLKEKNEILELLKVKVHSFTEYYKTLEKKIAALNANVKKSTSISNYGGMADSLLLKRYNTGLGYFSGERYDDAIFTFKSILYEQPNNILVSNCWFWIGESYFSLRDYKAANEAFEQCTKNAKHTFKKELSKIMSGLCHWKLGAHLKAQVEFESLLQQTSNLEYKSLLNEYIVQIKEKSSF